MHMVAVVAVCIEMPCLALGGPILALSQGDMHMVALGGPILALLQGDMHMVALGGPILALSQGDMHMLAVVAVCRNALFGTGWSNSCLVCTNRLRKHCSHLNVPVLARILQNPVCIYI